MNGSSVNLNQPTWICCADQVLIHEYHMGSNGLSLVDIKGFEMFLVKPWSMGSEWNHAGQNVQRLDQLSSRLSAVQEVASRKPISMRIRTPRVRFVLLVLHAASVL